MDIASGAFDYNTVLKRITNEMTNSGVRTVAYASGHTDRIEVAARRAVMTGFHQVVAKKAEQDMAALDTNYVEVTWHHGARPAHQVWQGKVYFWDRGFEDSLAEPPETLDFSEKSGILEAGNSSPLRIDMQFFGHKEPSDFKTIFLPKEEYAHVMHEVATNITEIQMNQLFFSKKIGDYLYTFVNEGGFGEWRIVGKEKIE